MSIRDRSRRLFASHPQSRAASRAGFTLVELLVALILLDLGLIALAGASAAITRVRSGAQADSHAQELASARVERLLSTRCAGPVAGVDRPSANVTGWWTDTPGANGVRFVRDSLVVTSARGPRSIVRRAAGRC